LDYYDISKIAMKNFFTAILIAVVALSSCSQKEDISIDANNKVLFTATADAPQSRSVLVEQDEKYHAEWVAGDYLELFEVTTTGTTTKKANNLNTTLTEGGKSVFVDFELKAKSADKFTYVLTHNDASMNGAGTYIAFVVPSTQAPTAMNTYDPLADFIVSKGVELTAQPTTRVDFQMARVTALAKVTIKNLTLTSGDSVKSVTFSCDKSIAGKITKIMIADLVAGNYPLANSEVSEPANSVTVTLPQPQTGNFSCYMSVWPTTLDAGAKCSVTVTTNGGMAYTKEITLPKVMELTSGNITAFTINMAGVGEQDAQVLLQPGKLVGLEQLTESVCNRAIKANIWLDAIARDKNMWAEGVNNELRELAFITAGQNLKATGAKLWGLHLPYSTYDIASLDETHRTEAVAKLSHIMDIALEHIAPHHLTIHPSTGSYLTTAADFEQHVAASRKSLVALQNELDRLNTLYGTSTILCVENCSKSVAYDGESLVSLLNYPGLDKVKVCIDTGHAQIPQNGKYLANNSLGDVVKILEDVGPLLGTLHIQQNIGLTEYPYDKHLQPWSGGLIDWGKTYATIVGKCGYRGCFLYETSWIGVYEGDTKTSIESTRENYDTVIIPAYLEYLKAL
jgi:hypothetical protein